MVNPQKYLSYSEEDFAADPFFRSWVLAPDEANQAFWSEWLGQYPEKKSLAENARWRMLQLRIEEPPVPGERMEHIWQQLQARKNKAAATAPASDTATKVIPLFSFKRLQGVAAVFLLLGLFAGLLAVFNRDRNAPLHYATAYGQTKTILLPDGSRVVLNGNSFLSYTPGRGPEAEREVVLQGEAFFEVTHTQNNQPFRVRLSRGLLVNVLGTQFTVTQRPTKTQVVLNEGKVRLSAEQQRFFGLWTQVTAQAVMQPGELVEVKARGQSFHKRKVDQPESFSAFIQNKIIFKNTPLSEVARVLEDTYGYQVRFGRPGLAGQRFSGTTPSTDIDMLFSAIEKLFGVRMTRQGKQVVIR